MGGPESKSSLKDFITFLGTVRGDLSTVSAPPFLLAPQSFVEFPSYWAERPSVFVAPSLQRDPALRALLVLKVWLSAMKRQYYVGATADSGIKKPLNSFLGECFLAEWDDGKAKTRVVAEQVSHHPPTTAAYISADNHGVRVQAYGTQATNLTIIKAQPAILIKQFGHAILHIDTFDEDHLLPLPDVQVKGFLSGALYPELSGTYNLLSSGGYTTEVNFSGKGLLSGGDKNQVDAVMYKTDDAKKVPLYTLKGLWNDRFTFFDSSGAELETFDVNATEPALESLPAVSQQDSWESRRAWAKVVQALHQGDQKQVVAEKGKLEDAQRQMRREEKEKGEEWRARYFTKAGTDPVLEQMSKQMDKSDAERLIGSQGVWRFKGEGTESGRGRAGVDKRTPLG